MMGKILSMGARNEDLAKIRELKRRVAPFLAMDVVTATGARYISDALAIAITLTEQGYGDQEIGKIIENAEHSIGQLEECGTLNARLAEMSYIIEVPQRYRPMRRPLPSIVVFGVLAVAFVIGFAIAKKETT